MSAKDQKSLPELARSCTQDLGKEVLPGDVYGIMLFGESYAQERGFTKEDYTDIIATVAKEVKL